MNIHFVCSGNTYRSRLAEAYLKSKLTNKKIKISSSGIAADKHKLNNGPITWYAMRILYNNGLIPYMSWSETQTTKEILEKVDLLICMRRSHLEYCQKKLNYVNRPFEVWNILDLNEMEEYDPSNNSGIETNINDMKLTDKTFKKIAKKVDDLVLRIKNKR